MLIFGSALLPLMIQRLTGEDDYYDSFSFNFYSGTDPGSIAGAPSTGLLAGYDAAAPWASTLYSTSLYLAGPISTHALAAGSPTYWELIGRAGGMPERLLHGSAGKTGSGADIVFANDVWAMGDPVTLNSLRIYPLRLSYPP